VIFISAGEASGDVVGAALIAELRRLGYDGPICAIGGSKMREAGAEIIADSSHWGVVGILQAFKVAPIIFAANRGIKRFIAQKRPELVIPIDFGYFNVRLARFAKSCGAKVLYFMPPGSWRRNGQARDLPSVTDRVATPFEWSAESLRSEGVNAEWVGHPILQLAGDLKEAPREYLALLPGSRNHEVALNLPRMAEIMEMLGDAPEPLIVAAPTFSPEEILRYWPGKSKPRVWTDGTMSALKRSKAAIVCSGTATLEGAICGTPMAVIYQVTKLMSIQWYLVRHKVKFIALPNVLLDRGVVPELLGKDSDPANVAAVMRRLIDDTPEREAQLKAFSELQGLLGAPTGISRTAEIALEMLD
jgi:lipid-A-disaccharide synthase